MSDMNDNTIPFGHTAEEIIARVTEEYGYPVCYGFPAGHIEENMALRLGTEATLAVTEKQCVLRF